MTYDGELTIIPGLVAAADLSALQYRFVKIDTSGYTAANVSIGAVCAGVLQNDPDTALKNADVANFGVSRMEYGAGVTAGDNVMSDNVGRAITTTGNYYSMGIALASGTVGGIGSVLIYPSGAANPSNSTTHALVAVADYQLKQYFFTVIDSTGKAQVNATLGASVHGVLQNAPDITESATIAFAGVSNILLGATVTAGDRVMSDAAGECITATSEYASVGICITGGTNGQTGTILLTPNSKDSRVKVHNLVAAADYQLTQYFFGNVDSSGTFTINTTLGANCIGVQQNTPDTAEVAEVCYAGITSVLLGATVTAGDLVMSDAAGECITVTEENAVLGVCIVGGTNGQTGTIIMAPSLGTINRQQKTVNVVAVADYQLLQYFGMFIDSAGKASVVAGSGNYTMGILQNTPDLGEVATVAYSGKTNVLLGATVAQGAHVMSDAAGECITATSGEYAYGVCLTGGDNGGTGIVLLTGGHYIP